MNKICIPSIPEVDKQLLKFEKIHGNIVGIHSTAKRQTFLKQLIDSIRDIEYCGLLTRKIYNNTISDPTSKGFNPIKAALYYYQNKNLDEAIWLIFLTIYFGKARPGGWSLIQAFYSGINSKYIWTWDTLTKNQKEFHDWIDKEKINLKAYGKFGNHRKYQSLKHMSRSIDTYLKWIGPKLSHKNKLDQIENSITSNPSSLFDYLYEDLSLVYTFGRTTKFDFLCMLGKLDFVNIEPGHPYIKNSTGPLSGSKLLFGNLTTNQITNKLITLGAYLNYPFIMQILEDGICNWQKNPMTYKRFTG